MYWPRHGNIGVGTLAVKIYGYIYNNYLQSKAKAKKADTNNLNKKFTIPNR